ncbi:hypothetical protein PUN28_002067 [Cardiocondyla obscurior]|uniref:Uncharacterized protein n=1 Tax=Cardiocondyla obscurior TaxID=286306 RepID=A0AAW2GSE6_9HYME
MECKRNILIEIDSKKAKFIIKYSKNKVHDVCIGFISDLALLFFDMQLFKVLSEKTLKTPTLRYNLELLNLKKLLVDVPTKENSTFDMLQKLLEFKKSCDVNMKERHADKE